MEEGADVGGVGVEGVDVEVINTLGYVFREKDHFPL